MVTFNLVMCAPLLCINITVMCALFLFSHCYLSSACCLFYCYVSHLVVHLVNNARSVNFVNCHISNVRSLSFVLIVMLVMRALFLFC